MALYVTLETGELRLEYAGRLRSLNVIAALAAVVAAPDQGLQRHDLARIHVDTTVFVTAVRVGISRPGPLINQRFEQCLTRRIRVGIDELLDQGLERRIAHHRLAQVEHIAKDGDIGQSGDRIAQRQIVERLGILRVDGKPDIRCVACFARFGHYLAALPDVITLTIGLRNVAVVDRHRRQPRLGKAQQFIRLRLAVAVGVLPDPNALLIGLLGIDLSIAVAVQLRQSFEAIGRTAAVTQ